MSLIQKPLILVGSKGREEITALFDSGASYSCVNADLAKGLGHLEQLSVPMEFETAEKIAPSEDLTVFLFGDLHYHDKCTMIK